MCLVARSCLGAARPRTLRCSPGSLTRADPPGVSAGVRPFATHAVFFSDFSLARCDTRRFFSDFREGGGGGGAKKAGRGSSTSRLKGGLSLAQHSPRPAYRARTTWGSLVRGSAALYSRNGMLKAGKEQWRPVRTGRRGGGGGAYYLPPPAPTSGPRRAKSRGSAARCL
jgi:hypothetical protein